MSKIPIANAKKELERIGNAVRYPILLVGGLAVQVYVKSRNSKDIDIVCDHDTTVRLLDELYPLKDWKHKEINDDDERPSYRITHRTKEMAAIYLGPKHTERESYAFIDWQQLGRNTRNFTHKNETVNNILIPSPAALAYSKFISYCARREKTPDKASQDLKDFCNLTQVDFDALEFLGYAIKLEAVDYIQQQYREMPSNDREQLQETSFFKTYRIFLGDDDVPKGGESLSRTRVSTDELPDTLAGSEGDMEALTAEILRVASKYGHRSPLRREFSDSLLIVVDVQNDFMEGGALAAVDASSVVDPINELVKRAHGSGCTVVYARDWHPTQHFSFDPWGEHGIANQPGAGFHPSLHLVDGHEIANIGEDNRSDPYTPFSDPRLVSLIAKPEIRTVYVVGIALEFCVLATCRDALCFGKTVIALEPYIRCASKEETNRENAWEVLAALGVVRAQNAPFPLHGRTLSK